MISGWGAAVKARLPHAGEAFRSLHSRAESQVIRLAAAYALADRSPEITPAHTEAALALLSYCAQSAEVVFGVPVAQLPPRVNPSHTAKIVRHLHDRYPEWTARDEIGSGVLRGNIPAADIESALTELAGKRLIEQRRTETAGRPREEYRLIAPQMTLFP